MKKFGIGCLGFIVALIVIIVVIAIATGGDDTKTASKEDKKDKPLTLEEQIKSDINDELGEKNNDKKDRIVKLEVEKSTGFVKVVLAGDQSLSTKSTKEKQLFDATDVFPILFKNDSVKKAMVTFQLPLVDAYGKETDQDVVRIMLERETNDKIVWKNFNIDNFSTVADSFYLHPALNKK